MHQKRFIKATFLVSLVLLAAVFVLGSISVDAVATEARIIVKFSSRALEADIATLDRRFGSDIEDSIPEIRTRVLKVPNSLQAQIVERLKNHPHIEHVEPDFIAQALFVPNDTYFADQWGLAQIETPRAWDSSHGNPTVKIAILDTGIDYNHGDLKNKVVANKNFTSSRSALDRNGHGTHVAGIAAAATNNAKGVAGVGFDSKLMNVKVLADNGSGYYSWIAKGIIYAADNGAKVINLSLGAPSEAQVLEDAIEYAWSKGVVVIAAAGNSNNDTPLYPAYYEPVIAVGATDAADARASFSSYGSWVDVAAPGVNILSTYPRIGISDRYTKMNGTSMAAPFVSGLAALVWNSASGTDNQTVRDRIESTTDALSDPLLGNGRINAFKALSF